MDRRKFLGFASATALSFPNLVDIIRSAGAEVIKQGEGHANKAKGQKRVNANLLIAYVPGDPFNERLWVKKPINDAGSLNQGSIDRLVGPVQEFYMRELGLGIDFKAIAAPSADDITRHLKEYYSKGGGGGAMPLINGVPIPISYVNWDQFMRASVYGSMDYWYDFLDRSPEFLPYKELAQKEIEKEMQLFRGLSKSQRAQRFISQFNEVPPTNLSEDIYRLKLKRETAEVLIGIVFPELKTSAGVAVQKNGEVYLFSNTYANSLVSRLRGMDYVFAANSHHMVHELGHRLGAKEHAPNPHLQDGRINIMGPGSHARALADALARYERIFRREYGFSEETKQKIRDYLGPSFFPREPDLLLRNKR